MGWFFTQSLLFMIIPAFLLGLLAGYLWWVWGWKKHKVTQETEVSRLRRLIGDREKEAGTTSAQLVDLRGEHNKRLDELKLVRADLDRTQSDLTAKVNAHASIAAERDKLAAELAAARRDRESLDKELVQVRGLHSESQRSLVDLRGKADVSSKELAESQKRFDAVSRDLAAGRIRVAELEKELAAAKAAGETSQRSLVDLRGKADTTAKDLDGARSRIAVLEQDLAAAKAAGETSQRSLVDLRGKSDTTAKELAASQAQVDAMRKDVTTWRSRAEATDRDLASARSRVAELDKQLVDVRGSRHTLERELNELRAKQSDADRTVIDLRTRHQDLEQQLVKVRTTHQSTEEQLQMLRQAQTRAETTATTTRSDLEARTRELASAKAEVDRLHGELARLQTEIRTIRTAPAKDDDLLIIEGIGPKMNDALRAAGIRTFTQLENSDVATLRTAIEKAGMSFAPSMTTWSRQAGYLARNDQVGFKAYVEHLVAGRDPGAFDEASARRAFAATPGRDDLKRIEGIGPKMEEALHAAGIRTFAQLAATSTDTIRSAIEKAGLKFAPSLDTWARQADLLAKGDEAGFAALTAQLVAGRDTGKE